MGNNVIYSINGPVIKVQNSTDFSMLEMVYVGDKRLIGEVISVSRRLTTIQVYESTTGLHCGEPVEGTAMPLCVKLGPGILSGIFDGIERPLNEIKSRTGIYISDGIRIPPLDENKKWQITLKVKEGDLINEGTVYAVCPETELIEHRSVASSKMTGQVVYTAGDGEYTINDIIIKIKDKNGETQNLTLAQEWPIRTPKPVSERLTISRPLITGQRIIDSMFPIAKGGTAAIPGGFGTGKTMTQHQLAKWCDADIIVYVGCGERGNEMTQVLEEFGGLVDPKSGKPLIARTVLIANTSNMPVAAREASIYTGITLAEYYRDMGYHVAIMADSTSRWAEALREISGRLEEMPAEEGFPAYLPSRISQFYERAGYVKTISGCEGSITIIGAVSPQGADFSEPVTQNTKRFVRCFWALDKSLAYERHYPAINWNTSYSDYMDDLNVWYSDNVDKKFASKRQKILNILHDENKLMEIVKLIGADVLPDDQKLVIEVAKLIRVGFLQQNAFHKDDTYVPLEKQLAMMDIIIYVFEKLETAISRGLLFTDISESGIFKTIVKMKYDIANDELEKFKDYYSTVDAFLAGHTSTMI